MYTVHVICGDVFVFVNNRISWKNMNIVWFGFHFHIRNWRKGKLLGESSSIFFVFHWVGGAVIMKRCEINEEKGESNEHYYASDRIMACRLWYGTIFFFFLSFRIAIKQLAIGWIWYIVNEGLKKNLNKLLILNEMKLTVSGNEWINK